MTTRAIEALIEGCAFDPRTLEIKFPAEALAECGVEARYFFEVLEDAPKLSVLSFLDNRWREDRISKNAYDAADPAAKIEIHAVICGMLHEICHRVDLLITPFGVQYLYAIVEEYRLLQNLFHMHSID
jgi:hypothetical protein